MIWIRIDSEATELHAGYSYIDVYARYSLPALIGLLVDASTLQYTINSMWSLNLYSVEKDGMADTKCITSLV